MRSNNSFLLSCVCSSVWSFGSRLKNWRLIIARVSEVHVAYHNLIALWYIYILGTNNIQHLKQRRDTSPSLLPYLHRRMCVRGGENNGGYRVRLKIGVRSLLHRKVQCQPTQLVVVMCLFLSMVVWQPFSGYWRLIIARVSEMHVAYHILEQIVVYLHPWNKQHSTSKGFAIPLLLSFLPYLHRQMCV